MGTLYLEDAWGLYSSNFRTIAVAAIVVTVVGTLAALGAIYAFLGAESIWDALPCIFVAALVFIVSFAAEQIYIYSKITGNSTGAGDIVSRTLVAIVASILWVLAIIAIFGVAVGIGALIALANQIAGLFAAFILFLAALIPAVILGLKMQYIPYLAAKGYSVGEAISRVRKVKTKVALTAAVGAWIAGIFISQVNNAVGELMKNAIAGPLRDALQDNAVMDGFTLLKRALAAALGPYIILLVAISTFANAVLQPFPWLIIYASAEDALPEE